jgi:hypothetical protein
LDNGAAEQFAVFTSQAVNGVTLGHDGQRA